MNDNIKFTDGYTDEQVTELVGVILHKHSLQLSPRIMINVNKVPKIKDSFEQHVKETETETKEG